MECDKLCIKCGKEIDEDMSLCKNCEIEAEISDFQIQLEM